MIALSNIRIVCSDRLLVITEAGVGYQTRAWIMSFCTSILLNLLALK